MSDGVGKAIPVQRFPRAEQKTPEQKIRDVADMYEKHFMREMVKAMRSTVHDDNGLIKVNQAERIFREQLDDEYVGKWSAKGGVGLSNLIYDQIVERYGAQMGIKAPIQKPHGPIPLDHKSEIVGRSQVKPTSTPESSQMDLQLSALNIGSPMEVRSPWSGYLVDKKSISLDEHLLEVLHDNGLKSRINYKGTVDKISIGSPVEAGGRVGLLSPDAKNLFWAIQAQGLDEKTVSE